MLWPLEASKSHVDPTSDVYKKMGLGSPNMAPLKSGRDHRKEFKSCRRAYKSSLDSGTVDQGSASESLPGQHRQDGKAVT